MRFIVNTLCFSLLFNIFAGKVRKPRAEIPANSQRIVKGLLTCDCSPTSQAPEEYSIAIVKAILSYKHTSEARVRAEFAVCNQKSKQSCVNADESFRNKGFNHSICTYDKNTGQNVFPTKSGTYRILGRCRTQNLSFNSGSSIDTDMVTANPPYPTPTTDAISSMTPVTQKAALKSKNEGCVAVEHLKGYALQHQYDLIRPVLCFEEFCATPNHALIIRGVYTSMNIICGKDGEWSGRCVSKERRVNNLRVIYHRSAIYNAHITITPYDIRFPIAAVWTVQIFQEVLRMSYSCALIIFNIRLPRFFAMIIQTYMVLLIASWLRTT